MTQGPRWYVCESHQGRERLALENLERQGFNSYLPMQLSRRARKGQAPVVVSTPFFPGYVFTQLDLQIDRWRAIFSTRGVRAILGSPEKPSPVPDRLIDDIRSAEIDGFIRLRPTEPDCPYESGAKVTYKGLISAVFCERVDHKRARILISYLSGESRPVVDLVSLS